MKAKVVDEVRRPTELPLWEVPGWRERFGITAGITGRAAADGTAFDLGLWSERPVGQVMGDWRRFRSAFPEANGMVLAHQVHGSAILEHDTPSHGWTLREGADGHLTSLPNYLLLVTVADCIPIYLAAPNDGLVALLHAGWRGTAGGILARAIALFQARGVVSKNLVMHAGVGICGASYEVGSEVMVACGKEVDGAGPWHLDLREVLVEQAAELGIGEVTISTHDNATMRDRFYSHRGSGGKDGRMVAWIEQVTDP